MDGAADARGGSRSRSRPTKSPLPRATVTPMKSAVEVKSPARPRQSRGCGFVLSQDNVVTMRESTRDTVQVSYTNNGVQTNHTGVQGDFNTNNNNTKRAHIHADTNDSRAYRDGKQDNKSADQPSSHSTNNDGMEDMIPFVTLMPIANPNHSLTLPDVSRECAEPSCQASASHAQGTSASQPPRPRAPPPPPLQQQPTCADHLVFHKNLDDDGVGVKAILEGITCPVIVYKVTSALRTVLFISFPLFTLGIHPNTMYKMGFPKMLMASVLSTSCSRSELGPHLGLMSWTWRSMIFALITGTIFNVVDLTKHLSAWWAMLGLGIFLTSLIGHPMLRQFHQMFFFIMLLEMRMYQTYVEHVPVTNTAHFIGLLMLGSLFGVASNLLPRPSLVAPRVDAQISQLYRGLGDLATAMHKHIWSFHGSTHHRHTAHECANEKVTCNGNEDGESVMNSSGAALLFFSDLGSLERFESVLSGMPAALWGCNWEPLEFPLRNPIRRLKLALLRHIMAMMYAAYGAGRTAGKLRCAAAERVAMAQMRQNVARRSHTLGQGANDRSNHLYDSVEHANHAMGAFQAESLVHEMQRFAKVAEESVTAVNGSDTRDDRGGNMNRPPILPRRMKMVRQRKMRRNASMSRCAVMAMNCWRAFTPNVPRYMRTRACTSAGSWNSCRRV